MKRILFITLLFVNLQIVMTEDGLSFTSMTVSAQTMMYEMLDEVEVNGELVNCKYGCGVRLCKREIEAHEESCPERMTECRTCHQSYKVSDGHDCMSKYVECPICRAQVRNEDFYNGRHTHNDPVTPPVTPSGGGNTGGSGEPVVGSYHPDNNGTTSIGNPPYLPQEIHATVKGEVLFKKNLPAKTLTQRAKMDCVSTSLGIVYSLMGSDKTAEEVRSEIEKLYKRETGEMLHAVGVRGSNNLNNLLENPKLNFEKINPTDILSSINDNMPIVAILDALNGSDKHMVVIVGYYDDWNTEAFQCINPGTGKYETHYSNEFYIKDIDGKNTITTYIYRKKY